jgi:hypothetical protein
MFLRHEDKYYNLDNFNVINLDKFDHSLNIISHDSQELCISILYFLRKYKIEITEKNIQLFHEIFWKQYIKLKNTDNMTHFSIELNIMPYIISKSEIKVD